MKLIILSIFLTVPYHIQMSHSSTKNVVAALPDYNAYRIYKMRAFFEIKSTQKLFVLKIA